MTQPEIWRLGVPRICLSLGVGLLLSLAQPSLAGQLSLSTSPLFLGTSVEPNVFFLSDDSGSMDWDIMTHSPIILTTQPTIRPTLFLDNSLTVTPIAVVEPA